MAESFEIIKAAGLGVDTANGVKTPTIELVDALLKLSVESDVFQGDADDASLFVPLLIAPILAAEASPPVWVFEAAARFGDSVSAHAIGDWAMNITDANLPANIAAAAVNALARDGRPVALLQLQRMASDATSSALAHAASSSLELTAQERGMRIWELEDTFVPMCGLGADEEFPFNYGRQKFGLVLDAWLKPQLFDGGTWRAYDSPPPADPSDDPKRVKSAQARFKMVRADVEDMLPVQTKRLEAALVEQFRWDVEHWRQHLLQHPVMRLLIQRLAWGVYSKAGRCVSTFRVSDDFTLTDANDDPTTLPENHFVGVLHPLDVGEMTIKAWSELFSNYEIITICPQFDRPTFEVPTEIRKEELVPIELEVSTEWGMKYLAGRRWQKNEGSSYGWEPIRRVFRTADVRVDIQCTFQEGTLQLHGLSFHRHLSHPQNRYQLRDVPNVVFSEAIREFEEMRSTWNETQG